MLRVSGPARGTGAHLQLSRAFRCFVSRGFAAIVTCSRPARVQNYSVSGEQGIQTPS